MRYFKKYWPVLFGLGLVLVFFYKYFFQGLIPFPGDLLTGAYYPWLEEKWGFAVGVPVKNPLISDVYSQLFLWKSLIIDAFKNGQWPLWNRFSYSGYPLLANFQSGVLNPLNLLMLIFGKIDGWSLMLVGQVFGSFLTMWYLLSRLKFSNPAKLVGSLVYCLGGFPIVWLEYATVGQAMLWSPLVIALIENYSLDEKPRSLLLLPFVFFLIVAGGHFQTLTYMAILGVGYFVFRVKEKSIQDWSWFGLAGILSVGLSIIQLLPTLELAKNGIRFGEHYAANFNYGLAPMKQMVSLLIPDFFGNPTTANYWGSFNYENTIYYAGVFAFIALIISLLIYKKLGREQFFLCGAIYSLGLGFDTYFGRAIYLFKVPGLSTSVAGRVGMVFTLCVAVLTASLIDKLDKLSLKEKLKPIVAGIFLIAVTSGIVLFKNPQFVKVGLKNSIFPIGILGLCLILILFKKIKYRGYLLAIILILDLFRFGWKYTTFSKRELTYPTMPIFEELKKDKDIFRVDREKGELLPPNTWTAYGLESSSGYDPMAVRDYVLEYENKLNGRENSGLTRYSEIDRYDAKSLGEFNVKYLLALKRDKLGRVPGDSINYTINLNDWDRVYESESTAVLKNKFFKKRITFIDQNEKLIEDFDYEVLEHDIDTQINYQLSNEGQILIRESWYPGWKARIDGKEGEVKKCQGIFKCIAVPAGQHTLKVYYDPQSFRYGEVIALLSLLIIEGLILNHIQTIKQ